MTRRYFEQEMRYLHEAGKAFAEANPEVGRYLNVDSLTDRDPYVERLFEGFALLAGRIHERLDDALPEYTESLLNLLYPHFLRPVPALCIVELRPRPGMVQETTVLEKGIELRSAPVGDEGAVCRFTTTQAVRLHPLRLAQAQLHYAAAETSSVRLQFELERGAVLGRLQLSPLRFYFHADVAAAAAMHLHFTRHVTRVLLSAEGHDPIVLNGQQWVRPGGLEPDESLLPYGPRSFTGFRLLQEYLSFRPKFWAVDLTGLERLAAFEGASRFTVEVVFDRVYPEDKRFGTENVRLYCTPAVNLFSMDAEPIRVEGRESEYRVIPSTRYKRSIEAYDVQAVTGIEDATGRRHRYRPFFDYDRNGTGGRYFTIRRRAGPFNRPEIYLSPSGGGAGDVAGFPPETLSLEIRATNGSLPRERLREGMINQLAPDVPQIVQPTNLRAPTLLLDPPSGSDPEYLWKLVSHLSFNYLSMASREALLGLLGLYDWTETDANRRRLAGIRGVRWEAKEEIRRGALRRGAEVTVEVQEGYFADEGDLCLFGLVLSEFLNLAATINAFVHLKIERVPTGKEYLWQPQRGVMPVL